VNPNEPRPSSPPDPDDWRRMFDAVLGALMRQEGSLSRQEASLNELRTDLRQDTEKLGKKFASNTTLLADHENWLARLNRMIWAQWAFNVLLFALAAGAGWGLLQLYQLVGRTNTALAQIATRVDQFSNRVDQFGNQVEQLGGQVGELGDQVKQLRATGGPPALPKSPGPLPHPVPPGPLPHPVPKDTLLIDFEAVVLVTMPVEMKSGGFASVVAVFHKKQQLLTMYEITFKDPKSRTVIDLVQSSATLANAQALTKGDVVIRAVSVPPEIDANQSYVLVSNSARAEGHLDQALHTAHDLHISTDNQKLPSAVASLSDLPVIFNLLRNRLEKLQTE
jgi:hypothetical protein